MIIVAFYWSVLPFSSPSCLWCLREEDSFIEFYTRPACASVVKGGTCTVSNIGANLVKEQNGDCESGNGWVFGPSDKSFMVSKEPEQRRPVKVQNPFHKKTILNLRAFAGTSGTSVITKQLAPVGLSASFKNYSIYGWDQRSTQKSKFWNCLC